MVLEVGASADNVTYEWQKSVDGGSSWSPVKNGDATVLMVSTTLSESSALYRCKVTATNGDFVLSDAAKITVNTANPTYTVKYYLENPDGTYGVFDQFVEEQPVGTAVTALERTFEHYTENTTMGTHSGTVTANSTLVLSRYYDRSSYTLRFETNGGAKLPAILYR